MSLAKKLLTAMLSLSKGAAELGEVLDVLNTEAGKTENLIKAMQAKIEQLEARDVKIMKIMDDLKTELDNKDNEEKENDSEDKE